MHRPSALAPLFVAILAACDATPWVQGESLFPPKADEPGGRDELPSVRLAFADGYNYGCSTCVAMRAVVEVENVGFEKDVAIAYSVDGGGWDETRLSYVASPTNDRDVFLTEGLGGREVRFAIRYRADGRESWDNNHDNDFLFRWGDSYGTLWPALPVLGDRDIVVTDAGSDSPERMAVSALVRSRSPDKQVELVYSFDGWNTTQHTPAQYVAAGYEGDVERWQVSLEGIADQGEMEFALSLEQAGATQWDNGFDQNYHCVRVGNHLEQGWKCAGGALTR